MYVRWGRLVCPSGATALYQGFASSTKYDYYSGTSSLLCLPNSPTYVETSRGPPIAVLYSTEYETWNYVFNVDDYDVPCVLCHVPRTSTVMIPGTPNCPNGLQTEYSGYLMTIKRESGADRGHSMEAVCVDSNPETMLGSEDDDDGALLFFMGADCNGSFMPCDPYKHLIPLSCAVCSS